MYSTIADSDLVRQTKKGNRKAFDMLMIRHQNKLACVISRYLKLPQQIEDATQEAFINAYCGIMSFRGDSKFSTWLYRIGVNTAIQYLATERSRIPLYEPSYETDTGNSVVPESIDEENPERMYVNRQIGDTIFRELKKLPEELCTAITLREIEGLSYEKIAGIMNCPVGTIRSRIFRARKIISVRLQLLLGSNPENYLKASCT